jgi:hypothetical protein
VLFAVDLDFRLIDGDFLAILAVRLEEVFEPVKPLSDRLIRPIDARFDPSVREASMIQKRREDTPLSRRVLTGKYFLLASLLNPAGEHCSTHQLTLARPLPSR